jgi:hypothetical protein
VASECSDEISRLEAPHFDCFVQRGTYQLTEGIEYERTHKERMTSQRFDALERFHVPYSDRVIIGSTDQQISIGTINKRCHFLCMTFNCSLTSIGVDVEENNLFSHAINDHFVS